MSVVQGRKVAYVAQVAGDVAHLPPKRATLRPNPRRGGGRVRTGAHIRYNGGTRSGQVILRARWAMSKVILDETLRAKLDLANGPTELCDADGKAVAYVLSAEEYQRILYD